MYEYNTAADADAMAAAAAAAAAAVVYFKCFPISYVPLVHPKYTAATAAAAVPR